MDHARIVIIGAGFSGLGMGIALARRGEDVVILERADRLGGTWRDNTYPGCQCDVPSHLYSFSFAPNPAWTRTYSTQPEIWDYLERTADRFGISDRIRFGHDVREAHWDGRRWVLDTTQGTMTADVVISGHGPLAEPQVPSIVGLETFEGKAFHSARWDHDHDLRGERVAVIGTGASAIQFIPKIQPEVGHLHVFQRTPAWVLPHTDRPTTRFERALYRRLPVAQRIVRWLIYWARELLVLGMTKDRRLIEPLRRLATAHLRRQVRDPELAAKLLPSFSPGCKRLLLSNDYYPSLQRDNVTLQTSEIVRVHPHGIETADGQTHEVDTIIFGTGFHVTDNPIAERVRGRDGITLAKAWEESGALAHLGTTVPAFPNLFLLAGPNTGIGHTSLVVMIEAQVRYIAGALDAMRSANAGTVEVMQTTWERSNAMIQRRMGRTVWNAGGCASWYLDEHGRNTTLWPDFTWRFVQQTRRFDRENYLMGASS